MAELKESIKLSSHIKNKLLAIKDTDEHTSMDSVIRSLIHDSEAYHILKEELKKSEKH